MFACAPARVGEGQPRGVPRGVLVYSCLPLVQRLFNGGNRRTAGGQPMDGVHVCVEGWGGGARGLLTTLRPTGCRGAACGGVTGCGGACCCGFALFSGVFVVSGAEKRAAEGCRGGFWGGGAGCGVNFFSSAGVWFTVFSVFSAIFFEKIFWRFGKRLYFCIRFRRKRGAVEKGLLRRRERETFETDEKREIACVGCSVQTGRRHEDESKR